MTENLEPLQPGMPSRAQLMVELNHTYKINYKGKDARQFRKVLARIAYRNVMLNDRSDHINKN